MDEWTKNRLERRVVILSRNINTVASRDTEQLSSIIIYSTIRRIWIFLVARAAAAVAATRLSSALDHDSMIRRFFDVSN